MKGESLSHVAVNSELQPMDLLLSWQKVEDKKFITFLTLNTEVKNITVPEEKGLLCLSKQESTKEPMRN